MTILTPTEKINLLDLDFASLTQFFVELGEKSFRGTQVFQWLHQRGLDNFAEMTDLSKDLRAKLPEICEIKAPQIVQEQRAADSTCKWLMQLADGNKIETVFIPEKNRGTLCISSQVGCILNCSFCSTGKQGFNRNLTVSEIIGQIWQARRRLQEITAAEPLEHWHSKALVKKRKKDRLKPETLEKQEALEDLDEEEGTEFNFEDFFQAGTELGAYQENDLNGLSNGSHSRYNNATRESYCSSITNVVMMGMGEPLLNYDAVIKAMSIMRHDFAYNLAKRRVTLSTSGVVPNIDRLKVDSDVALAVSLHAPNDELRDVLVPLNKKYPIAELLAACKRYVADDRRKKITFEYVMLQGVNDTVFLAKQLAKILRDVPCKINLIPFNSFAGIEYQRSYLEDIQAFQRILQEAGYVTTIRKTRGMDIDAACGQLKGRINDRTRRNERWLAKNPQLKEGRRWLDVQVSV